MKAELAKIRAELDAKARGVNYGFKMPGMPERRSSREIESWLREVQEESDDEEDEATESDDEGDEVMDSDTDDEEEDEENESDDAESSSLQRRFSAPGIGVEFPRGVTIRPSGKWVSS